MTAPIGNELRGSEERTTGPPIAAPRRYRILSPLRGLPRRLEPGIELEVEWLDVSAIGIGDIPPIGSRCRDCDAVILYEPSREFLLLGAIRGFWPFARARLVIVDLIVPNPEPGFRAGLRRWVKRMALRHVDLFILHIKDTARLERYYGVDARKVRYIPFKVNSFERGVSEREPVEGDYIFTGGKSRRDYRTYCRAMEGMPYPAIILTPPAAESAVHETFFRDEDVPASVRLVRDDGSSGSWIEHMANAKVVVVPIDPETVSASGIGTYLLAMALKRCVVVTDSPATRGILQNENQAIIVPPRDPDALRAAVRKAWEDDDYRRGIAERGHAYATSLGGEAKLLENIATTTVQYLCDVEKRPQSRQASCDGDQR